MVQPTAASSMRKPNGRLTLILLVLAMLCIGGVLALPWILNRPAIVEILSREFEQRTGLTVSVEAWHVRLFPSLGLELLQAQAHEPGSPTALFVADRLEIALQWLPLLDGRVVGKDLVIDRPRLTLRRATDGTWSFGGSRHVPPSGDSPPPF
ncbi:MAG: AsmA family protein, partial [Nitrospira sp.]